MGNVVGKRNFADKTADKERRDRIKGLSKLIAQARRLEFTARFGDDIPEHPSDVAKAESRQAYNQVVKGALKEQSKKRSFVEERPILKVIFLGKHPIGKLADKAVAGAKKIYAGRVASDEGYFIRAKKK